MDIINCEWGESINKSAVRTFHLIIIEPPRPQGPPVELLEVVMLFPFEAWLLLLVVFLLSMESILLCNICNVKETWSLAKMCQ